MAYYEIRVLTPDYKISRIFPTTQVSDFAVIRRAKILTPNGEGVEVWRGDECIYANHCGYALSAAEASEDVPHGI